LNTPVRPHPLSPLQRIALVAMRVLMSVFSLVSWWRRRGIPNAIECHRYGVRRDETLEIIHPAGDGAGGGIDRGTDSGTDSRADGRAESKKKRTAVVYLHGGGWIIGNKELYSADLLFLTDRGYTVFNFDYPLAPEHPHPIPLASLMRGLAWFGRQHPEFEAIHLMGDSAGGNLAMMLGLLIDNPTLRRDIDPALEDLSLPRVRSVVSIYGVLDRTSWLDQRFPGASVMLQSYAGRAAFEPEVGPELAITPVDLKFDHHPPCLITIGTKDQLAESSRIAFDRLYRNDGRMRLIEYEGEGHGFLNFAGRPNSQKLRRDIIDFLAGCESSSATEATSDPRTQGSVAT